MTLGNLLRMLGLYLGDDRVTENQLGKTDEEDFRLTTEEVGFFSAGAPAKRNGHLGVRRDFL